MCMRASTRFFIPLLSRRRYTITRSFPMRFSTSLQSSCHGWSCARVSFSSWVYGSAELFSPVMRFLRSFSRPLLSIFHVDLISTAAVSQPLRGFQQEEEAWCSTCFATLSSWLLVSFCSLALSGGKAIILGRKMAARGQLNRQRWNEGADRFYDSISSYQSGYF